jgi:hypothetical protein
VKFVDVFLEAKSVMLLPLGGSEYAIKLKSDEPSYGSIYNLSE